MYDGVRKIHENEGVPIDDCLFERVGKETGIGGKTVVAELYGRVARIVRQLNDAGVDLGEHRQN